MSEKLTVCQCQRYEEQPEWRKTEVVVQLGEINREHDIRCDDFEDLRGSLGLEIVMAEL